MINQNQKEKFYKFIEDVDSIILISHENPDRDAIGSLVSMYQILKKLGKDNVLMLNETGHNIKPRFLKYQEDILIAPLEDYIFQYDAIILLDQGSLRRVSKINPKEFEGKRVGVIDHHLTPTNVENEVYIHDLVSSNCQLIYELFEGKIDFDKDLSKSLLMGMFDDTGGFRYPSVNSKTFEIVSKLLLTGIDISEIAEESKSISATIFDAAKVIINNTKIDPKTRMFISYISLNQIDELEIQFNQVEAAREAAVSLVLNRDDVDWGVFVRPSSSGDYSASFRSKRNTVDVEKIAQKFGGGGHKNAAGTKVNHEGTIEEIIEFVLREIQ